MDLNSSVIFSEFYPMNPGLSSYIQEISVKLQNIQMSDATNNVMSDFHENGIERDYEPPSLPSPVPRAIRATLMRPPTSCSPVIPPSIRLRTDCSVGECVFCRNNGEEPAFCRSHRLKDLNGKVSCPILRMYKCPVCEEQGGDYAHTIKYCPLNRSSKVVSSSSILRTKRTSTGTRRRIKK